jgi:hypothetical protein
MLAVCLAGTARANEVYKSVDAQGHLVYSDRAISANAQKTDIRVDRPDPAEVAQYAREQEILKAEETLRKKQQAAEAQRQNQTDHTHDTSCEAARNHYYDLKEARRVYVRDADGNRVYISDADAQVKRTDALQAMQDACGT